MLHLVKGLWKEESGQGMAEYGLILALVAVALIGGLQALKGGLEGTFNAVTSAVGGGGGE